MSFSAGVEMMSFPAGLRNDQAGPIALGYFNHAIELVWQVLR